MEHLELTDEQREFLTNLRDSGAANMFGATPFLMREFGLNKTQARDVLLAWMLEFK